MKKSRAYLLAGVTGMICIVLTVLVMRFGLFQSSSEAYEEFLRVEQIIQNNYLRDYDMDELRQAALKAMVAALDDPYSVYYTPEEFAAFQQDASGEYYGVGMGITIDEVTGLAVIVYFLEDSPAEEAGLQVGDYIISIDGVDVTKKTLQDIRVLCIGEEGTTLTIGVKRGDEVLEFTVERKSIELDMVEYTMLDGDVGYMRIKQFGGNCETLFEQGLDYFEEQDAQGIVFDLRNNPGGYLNVVVNVLDSLLPEGTIVYTEDKYGNRDTKTSDADCVKIPMVVLVNGNTASASEIFAGAIQDYDWGEVIGTRTFGKGVVQTVIPIQSVVDGETLTAGVKITTSEYFTPKGRSIDGNGVYPDEYVELRGDASEDKQLAAGLEQLAVLIGTEQAQETSD